MNKLKQKMFIVLFCALSAFMLFLAVFFNLFAYSSAKQEAESTLWNTAGYVNKLSREGTGEFYDARNPFFYSELPVAIVSKNRSGEAVAWVSEEDAFDEEDLEHEISFIHDHFKPGMKNVSNLYLGQYAFLYQSEQIIVITDTEELTEKLWISFFVSMIILAAAEITLALVCAKLVKWMIRPIEESFEKQKQFIADSSHELKTPLAVIMASAEAMEAEYPCKWLDNITYESKRMSDLISQLLNLTKTDSQETMILENTDLSKLTEKALLPYESIIFEKGACLNYSIQPDIYMEADSTQFKQLVAILLDNAVEHTYKNGVIDLNLAKKGHTITLAVANNGEPLKKGEEDKIFERFYRGDSSRNRKKGHYGLGLSIAKSIVLNHQGQIRAFSKEGWTYFVVTFNNGKKKN